MKLLRSLLVITPAAGVLTLAPVAAHADIAVPAPPGSASGVAAQVGSLLDVSRTDATAGAGAASADASVIRLAGEPLLGLGGTQNGDGDSGGALVDTGSTLPAQIQVAPWHAAASGTHTSTSHAKSSAAVGRANLPGVVSAGVLTSDSEASHTDQLSTGKSVTDGADVGLLDSVRIVVLHSEVDSAGHGHSYLASLNGTELGTDQDLGNSPLCALDAPGLLGLSCLTATGGNGATAPGGLAGGLANVLNVTPALDALSPVNPVAAFTASASSGTGAAPIATTPAPAPVVAGTETSRGLADQATNAPADTAVAGQATGKLPRTGVPAASLAGTAFALLLSGLGLRRFRLRPTAH
jgi:hypothetical protein